MIPQLKLSNIPDLFLDKGRRGIAKHYWVRLDFVNTYIKDENGKEDGRERMNQLLKPTKMCKNSSKREVEL